MEENRNLATLQAVAMRLRRHVINMVAPSCQGYVLQGLWAADIFASLNF